MSSEDKPVPSALQANANGGPGQWKKGGASPNPGGKPKGLPQFRRYCRADAQTVRAEIMRRIAADSTGEIPLKELVQAFAELSDRGGFLKSKEEQELDGMRAKLVLLVMGLDGLKPEQREKLLAAVGE